MKMICGVLALCVLLLPGCGGGTGLPSSSTVTLNLAPMQSTTAPGGTVILQASVSGFTEPPNLVWEMKEQHDAGINGSENCDNITAANQELIAGCRFGYIVVEVMQQNSSQATYHAPLTPGTYHVTFRAWQMSKTVIGESIEKQATATLTVQ